MTFFRYDLRLSLLKYISGFLASTGADEVDFDGLRRKLWIRGVDGSIEA